MNRALNLRKWHLPVMRAGQDREQRARTRADRALARRVAATFDRLELPSAESLSFYVRDEAVTVYGLVAGESDRDFVLQTLRRIPGVREVGDGLQLVAPEELAGFEDD